MSELDDELDIEPRTAAQVAKRLLILAALCHRAATDQTADSEEAPEERFDLLAWVESEGAGPELTGRERSLLQSTSEASMAEDDVMWAAESFGAIASSVGIGPALPEPPDFVASETLARSLPEPGTSATEISRAITVPADDRLALERERWELWHWRAATELALRQGVDRATERELREAIEETARDAAAAALLPSVVGDDFPLDSEPFRSIEHDALELFTVAAEQRLRALNWLCGFGESWDDIPLDL